jgi:hypothetical protein
MNTNGKFIMLFVITQLLDLVSTMITFLLFQTPKIEFNPIMRFFMEKNVWYVVVIKLFYIVLGVWLVRKCWSKLMKLGSIFSITLTGSIAFLNFFYLFYYVFFFL